MELLRGTPVSADARAQLIADREAEERTRQSRRQSGTSRQPRAQPDVAAREAALDQATEQVMLRVAADEAVNDMDALAAVPEAETALPTARSPSRPRRRVADATPVVELLSDDNEPGQL